MSPEGVKALPRSISFFAKSRDAGIILVFNSFAILKNDNQFIVNIISESSFSISYNDNMDYKNLIVFGRVVTVLLMLCTAVLVPYLESAKKAFPLSKVINDYKKINNQIDYFLLVIPEIHTTS